MGTAIGSSMAPSYASLFMGKLENDFLNARVLKATLWLRFLDDIFMIWDHSLTHSILESILLIHLENLRVTDKPLENCIF